MCAAEKKIAGGYSDGTFRPNDTCLREHVVTFLWRYAGKPAPKTSKNPLNDVYTSDYYYKAAIWANEKGIAKGYTTGEHAGGFGPKLDCLREHVATFLYTYVDSPIGGRRNYHIAANMDNPRLLKLICEVIEIV